MSDSHHRRSIRLQGYDYTLPGAYFVTLVIQMRECLFGEILGGEMHLNMAGEIARQEWFKTSELRSNVYLNPDEFVVMPNHVHGVIWIVEVDDTVDVHGVGARVGAAPLQQKPTQTSHRMGWGRLCVDINRRSHIASMPCVKPEACHCGNATIMNISSVTRLN